MKIRTEADIERLDQKIKSELNIDVRKYKDESVAEKFVALLVFPEYIITWMIGPLLLAIFLFVLGFFVLNLVHVEYVLYVTIGLVLFLIAGFSAGFLLLTKNMKKDIGAILDYSLSMTEAAVMDVNFVNKNASPEYKKDSFALLFKGIIHIVTIPMTTTVISEKLPLFSIFINKIIKKFFTLISDRVNFKDLPLNAVQTSAPQESSRALNLYSKSMSYTSLGMGKLMNLSFGLVRFPFKIIFWIIILLLLLLLWGIN